MKMTHASRFGLALYGVGLGLALKLAQRLITLQQAPSDKRSRVARLIEEALAEAGQGSGGGSDSAPASFSVLGLG
jgi:hypothetical protein